MSESQFSSRRRRTRSQSSFHTTPQTCPDTGLFRFTTPCFIADQARASLARQASLRVRFHDVETFVTPLDRIGGRVQLAALGRRCNALGLPVNEVVRSLTLAGWVRDGSCITKGSRP